MSILTYRKPLAINTSILKNHINNTLISKVAGKNPNTDVFMYTNIQDPYTPNILRDSNCWLNGVNNIGFLASAQRDGSAPWSAKLVSLISPRHVLFSGHYGPNGFSMKYLYGGGASPENPFQCGPNPVPIVFTNGNNQSIVRNIVKGIYTLDSSYYGPNAMGEAVGLLDKDIPPESFPFIKVLPPNFSNYLGTISSTNPLYAVTSLWTQSNFSFPQNGIAPSFINELYKTHTITLQRITYLTETLSNSSNNSSFGVNSINNTTNTLEGLLPWFVSSVKSGDSGRPVFIIIDNELVLLGLWASGGGGLFISAPQHYHAVNLAMQKLGGNYQLTPIDLNYIYNKYNT